MRVPEEGAGGECLKRVSEEGARLGCLRRVPEEVPFIIIVPPRELAPCFPTYADVLGQFLYFYMTFYVEGIRPGLVLRHRSTRQTDSSGK